MCLTALSNGSIKRLYQDAYSHVFAALFFTILIVFGSFFFLNLFLAVLGNALETEQAAEEKRQKKTQGKQARARARARAERVAVRDGHGPRPPTPQQEAARRCVAAASCGCGDSALAAYTLVRVKHFRTVTAL
jgi:hypothetical protein